MEIIHVPVMKSEALQLLRPRGEGWIVDASVGLGGHAEAIVSTQGFTGRLLGLDRDADALAIARRRLEPFQDRVRLRHAEFADLGAVLSREGLGRIDGLLIDLGVSSMQLENPDRGFSLLRDGPIDMRMDPSRGETVAQLLGRLGAHDLETILREYGEERYAGRIARAIIEAQRAGRLHSTGELADVIARAVRQRPGSRRLHPATRSFMAMRLFVNRELDQLKQVMMQAPDVLNAGGRLVVIAYHSLEDRITKQTLRAQARQGVWELLTPKPLRPSLDEVRANPRCRSGRLRAALRLAPATD